MADKLSKFNIKGTLADVIDLEARNTLASQSESMSEIQSEIDSQSVAYSEMFSEVDDDIATKQDTSSATKYARASATFKNVTISADGGGYNFNIPIPEGVTNARPVFARSTTSLAIAITNMFVSSPNIVVRLNNMTNADITQDSLTIEVTYLYN